MQKCLMSLLIVFSMPSFASNNNWFVRPYIGLSSISDISANSDNIAGESGRADIALNGGFTAGFALGYQYNERFAAEFAWEYRTNDSEVTLPSGERYSDGNYASNIFFINGFYYFDTITDKLHPFAGVGLSWIQEVDIDLEREGVEFSYAGDGDFGVQVMLGLEYELNRDWHLRSELRYGRTSGIELSGEGATVGSFDALEYNPITLQFSIRYGY